jgi:ParB family transcriptional regulator, chromosome partitioning protein
MRLLPWGKPKTDQLELLDADSEQPCQPSCDTRQPPARQPATNRSSKPASDGEVASAGRPLLVPLDRLIEDPNNPRTDFPETELDELAEDILQHGVLQPLVVYPADAQGRYRIHFGAKRWRAAQRAGLSEVPVVMRDEPADPYTQVAENQKRHGLSPLDLARFIKSRVDAGESNATVARRLGMNLTTLAHHLWLLELPPVLDQALKAGRCTSPRTLHELSKLHEIEPDRVRTLVEGPSDITRTTVVAMRAKPPKPGAAAKARSQADLITCAHAACDQLERLLARINTSTADPATADQLALRQRVAALASRCSPGV